MKLATRFLGTLLLLALSLQSVAVAGQPAQRSQGHEPAQHASTQSFASSGRPGGSATNASSSYRPSPYRPSSTNSRRDDGDRPNSTNYRPSSTNYRQSSTSYRASSASDHTGDALDSSHVAYGGTYRRANARSVAGVTNGRIANSGFYRSVTSVHDRDSVVRINTVYAEHAAFFHGAYWGDGWYHGYWHSYWAAQPWAWYNGSYGFWLAAAGVNVFLTETSPGVCSYWNGVAWVPYYNPPYTPYYCPY
jgi:hypothetical protein